jgi:hypothetical protein
MLAISEMPTPIFFSPRQLKKKRNPKHGPYTQQTLGNNK